MHVAVAAQRDVLARELLEQRDGLAGGRALGERVRHVDRDADQVGERLDRLHAAHVRDSTRSG